jgi:PIN domain nuclease of toxin-antitoxin system
MNGLILDTHVWYWINDQSKPLSSAAVDIVQSAQSANKIYIAAISLWEIAMMTKKEKITLRLPLTEWFQVALSIPGVNLSPLTPEVVIESMNLPGGFHGDPADRLIVATARVENLTLVTCDRKILEYAALGFVKAITI